MAGDGAERDAVAAERSAPFRWLVRAGFFSRALTYGVMGGLAFALAFGAGSRSAAPSQQGALALIDEAPLGVVALVLIAVGLIAYALWKLSQAAFGHGPEGGGGDDAKDRLFNFFGGVAYLVFFAVAVRVIVEGGGGSSGRSGHPGAGILGWPGGPVIVGLGGGALVAISAFQIYDAASGGFASQTKTAEMGREERETFVLLGRVGLIARALVFALVGYFVIRSALDFSPGSSVGVDGALARLHRVSYGPWLLGLAAAGLIVFAAYSALEGRYRRL